MNYKTDDNALMTVDYDNRQRIENYKVASSAVVGGFVQNYDYEYYADSKLKKVDNLVDADHKGFDRDFEYDHQGRLVFNFFDEVPVPNSAPTSPYHQGIEYDKFSNMTRRYNYIWGYDDINEFDATYTNNRQDATNEEVLTYDASGRATKVNYTPNTTLSTKYMTSKFDARGIYIESLNREITGGGGSTYTDQQFTVAQTFDTDGQRTKNVETDYVYSNQQGTTNDVETFYYVNSTVTGKTITELYDNGTKKTTNVYFGSAVMATQTINSVGNIISWKHSDPLTGSTVDTRQDGYNGEQKDFEPLGGLLSRTPPPGGETGYWKLWSEGGNAADSGYGCENDGYPMPCNVKNALDAYVGRINERYTVTTITWGSSKKTGASQTPKGNGVGGGGNLQIQFGAANGGDGGKDGKPCKTNEGEDGTWIDGKCVANSSINTVDVSIEDEPVEFNSPYDAENGGGGGGGSRNGLNKGKKATFSQKQFEKCLGLINVTIKSVNFSRESVGTFEGTAIIDSGNELINKIAPGINLQVSTNVKSKNSNQLATSLNIELGKNKWLTQSGLTLSKLPKNNFIANDLASNTKKYKDIGVLAVFIHELGNAIGVQLYGKGALVNFGVNGLNNDDRDFGTNLEHCVFDGIVGVKSGKVGANREF